MDIESEIFELSMAKGGQENLFSNAKLLKITAYSQLWRVARGGKYFLVKTTKDNNEAQLNILKREYELSIGCNHPYIVHTYVYDYVDGVGEGIIMEYVEGDTLAEYLAKNPPKSERLRLFGELLSAVGYLHNRGIIHNDLKMDNILVTRAEGTLKLIDFGLADTSAHYALKGLGCTPRYASPELRERSGEVDVRSDIYSLGVIMQDMLGKSRFSRRCMQVQPEKRYANVEALQKALHNRRRIWYFVASLAALALMITPLTLYLKEKSEQRDYVIMRDAKVAQLERAIGDIYREVSDSAAMAPYYEFAIVRAQSFYERSGKVCESIIDDTPHEEIKAMLQTKYNVLFQKYNIELLNRMKRLPLLPIKELSIEEIEYYHSLIDKRASYVPYSERVEQRQ